MKRIGFSSLFASAAVLALAASLPAQQPGHHKGEDTEVWSPVPAVVTPGATDAAPPSDAIVLFDGKNTGEWVQAKDNGPVQWPVADGVLTVRKVPWVGAIRTRRSFKNYQLHIEWKIPTDITGSSQERGNSGVFLAAPGPATGAFEIGGYELQVLDSYNNPTYVNGQAGAIYKQSPPLVNPNRKPGEWQTYDVVWTAPIFNADGSLKTPAYATVFFNGVLVQNHFELQGMTSNVDKPSYKAYDRAPIELQAHTDKSQPISYRNIWIRELP
jgi:hypothetical protein